MNKFLLTLLSLCISCSSAGTLARSKNFAEFRRQKIDDKKSLLRVWGQPSTEMDFNLPRKKYLYLRYTDENQYPLADFTIDPEDNSVLERLYYPQKSTDSNVLSTFMEKYFKDVNLEKVLDSCSHHDQFIHYNKTKSIFAISHQLLNNKRIIDVIGYSTPEIIENRLQENKTKECGIKKSL